jgi:hypothetical protein
MTLVIATVRNAGGCTALHSPHLPVSYEISFAMFQAKAKSVFTPHPILINESFAGIVVPTYWSHWMRNPMSST